MGGSPNTTEAMTSDRRSNVDRAEIPGNDTPREDWRLPF